MSQLEHRGMDINMRRFHRSSIVESEIRKLL